MPLALHKSFFTTPLNEPVAEHCQQHVNSQRSCSVAVMLFFFQESLKSLKSLKCLPEENSSPFATAQQLWDKHDLHKQTINVCTLYPVIDIIKAQKSSD